MFIAVFVENLNVTWQSDNPWSMTSPAPLTENKEDLMGGVGTGPAQGGLPPWSLGCGGVQIEEASTGLFQQPRQRLVAKSVGNGGELMAPLHLSDWFCFWDYWLCFWGPAAQLWCPLPQQHSSLSLCSLRITVALWDFNAACQGYGGLNTLLRKSMFLAICLCLWKLFSFFPSAVKYMIWISNSLFLMWWGFFFSHSGGIFFFIHQGNSLKGTCSIKMFLLRVLSGASNVLMFFNDSSFRMRLPFNGTEFMFSLMLRWITELCHCPFCCFLLFFHIHCVYNTLRTPALSLT